ncbi:MAG: hypothetical protein NW224_04385, partial [Leptolyngbyaceae cyanobacterium bins.302]|nr:hypothetical protein [Leptolyngbyaceae cyanobacterium bins.302]
HTLHLPSSPALLPTLREGSQKGVKLPPHPDLGEEGWGGEGKIVAHRVVGHWFSAKLDWSTTGSH